MYQAPLILLCESVGTRLTATCTHIPFRQWGLQDCRVIANSHIALAQLVVLSHYPCPAYLHLQNKSLYSRVTYAYAQPQSVRSALIRICIKERLHTSNQNDSCHKDGRLTFSRLRTPTFKLRRRHNPTSQKPFYTVTT